MFYILCFYYMTSARPYTEVCTEVSSSADTCPLRQTDDYGALARKHVEAKCDLDNDEVMVSW